MASVNAVQFLDTSSGDQALALKIYSGSFVEAYRNTAKLVNTSLPVVHRKTVSGAISYQLLQMADIPDPDEEFTPGNQLLGQDYGVAEVTVSRDKYIIAHKWVPRDEMHTSHFDIMPKLARSHARKIAMVADKRLFALSVLAARTAAVTKNGLTVHSGGNTVTRSGGSIASAYPLSATGAANFRADARALFQAMSEANIPAEGRYMWIPPVMQSVLQYDNTGQLWSNDYNAGTGNDVNNRQLKVFEGFKIVDTVNQVSGGGSLPNTNVTTGPSKYQGNFTAATSTGIPAAVVLCEGGEGDAAISMGTWESVQNVVWYDPTRLAYFVGSFLLMGAGKMSPWLAGSIEVKT